MTSRFSSVAWQNPNFNKLHFEKQNRFGVPKKIFGSKKDLGVQKRFLDPKIQMYFLASKAFQKIQKNVM